MKRKLEAWELTGKKLKAYRDGFRDGDQGDYFPCLGKALTVYYDWGHRDGRMYGGRKGKPWTLAELLTIGTTLKK